MAGKFSKATVCLRDIATGEVNVTVYEEGAVHTLAPLNTDLLNKDNNLLMLTVLWYEPYRLAPPGRAS